MGFKLNVWNKTSNKGLDETTEAHTLVHGTPMTYMMTRWVSDSQEHLQCDNPTLHQMPHSPSPFRTEEIDLILGAFQNAQGHLTEKSLKQ